MNIGQLNTVGVGRIYGAYECPCCGRHEIAAKVAFGAGVVDKLADLMADAAPSGATVALVYDENAREAFVAARRSCMRGGLLTCEIKVAAEPTVYEAEKIALPEQTRAVVAVGGGTTADLSKYAAQFSRLPVYIVYTGCDVSPLAPSSLLYCRNAPTRYAADPPRGLVCDPDYLPDDPKRDAAALGSILSVLSALFDRYIAWHLTGESRCPALAEQAYAAVEQLVEHLSGRYGTLRPKTALARAAVRLSQLTALKGDSWLVAGAETDAWCALRMLYKKEGFRCRSQGETTLLLSRILLRVYRASLEAMPLRGFYPPPDNNERSRLLEAFLGMTPSDAALRPAPLDKDLGRTLYKLDAVRNEALTLLSSYIDLQERGYEVFRRLYPDYGYGLLHYIEPDDAKLIVGLAPDLGGKYTFLTLLKSAGLLEGYLT